MGQIDLVVYSLASPRRLHPKTGVDHRSVLKPVGDPCKGKTVDLTSENITEITIHPATDAEVADTIAVMGGEDLEFWVESLLSEDLLAPQANIVAYSYIGPQVTAQIYSSGTSGVWLATTIFTNLLTLRVIKGGFGIYLVLKLTVLIMINQLKLRLPARLFKEFQCH